MNAVLFIFCLFLIQTVLLLFPELTHNVSLELKAEVRSGGQHGIYLYKDDDDEAINDRFVDLGYALAESGSKLEVNRELEHSLLDPHRTKHMGRCFGRKCFI